jgi:hypothetical protein
MSNMTAPTLLALGYALGPNGTAEALEIDGLLGASAITGDVVVTNDVAVVQPTKLAAATLAAIKTDTGTKALLAAAANDRQVIVTVNVTTVFAAGDGAAPTLSIGQTGSVSKFAATSIFVTAAAGATFTFGGTLTGGDALIATQVAGTGTTETGAYTITAIAVG